MSETVPETTPKPFHGEDLRAAVESNTQLLFRIQQQLQSLSEGLGHRQPDPVTVPVEPPGIESAEWDSLHARIAELTDRIDELEQQNSDLAAQLASSHVCEADPHHDTLTWADRKQLILQQLEEGSFDAAEFHASLQAGEQATAPTDRIECADPIEYIERLHRELATRDEAVRELQHLLGQRSDQTSASVTLGAAAIADLMDSDELVREERARLQALQLEWEEKFRKAEVELSLERAKISRERRELAGRQSQLEHELELLRLKALQASEKDAPRKWLSQLGLTSS
jgi:hypothetical protein